MICSALSGRVEEALYSSKVSGVYALPSRKELNRLSLQRGFKKISYKHADILLCNLRDRIVRQAVVLRKCFLHLRGARKQDCPIRVLLI